MEGLKDALNDIITNAERLAASPNVQVKMKAFMETDGFKLLRKMKVIIDKGLSDEESIKEILNAVEEIKTAAMYGDLAGGL